MAKASEQFRQSDVTLWGIVALVLGGFAVLGANVSAIVPSTVLGNLHKSRVDGASVDQLRRQVAELRDETGQLRRENGVLATRFALAEQQGNQVVQRVGALEVSVPRLLESAANGQRIDRSSMTASIGQALVYDADGGSVKITREPMPELATTQAAPVETAPPQPLPEPVAPVAVAATPNLMAFGIALGSPVTFEQAPETWRDLSMKLGPLLFGLAPLLTDEPNSDEKRIVVGPITQLSEATALCTRLERISIACLPMPFDGTPLSY